VPRLAVIGFPVGHSRSPAMQNAALAALGLAGEWEYGALEVAPDDFEATVREIAAGGEYAGVNVTVPHKEAALALADEASAAARAIGAANTLSFAAGRVAAGNTDAAGLVGALPDGFAAEARGEGGRARALVLGAGGAARAVIWALSGAGAATDSAFPNLLVDVWNRTATRATEVCAELGGEPLAGVRGVPVPGQEDYALIVNTTAVGLHGEDPFEQLPLGSGGFAPGQVVVDMVYGERPSALLGAAAAAGATAVDGLEVLVQQGARSLRIWTGRAPDLDVMRGAARR
jgi:shikimate dehydrogenase